MVARGASLWTLDVSRLEWKLIGKLPVLFISYSVETGEAVLSNCELCVWKAGLEWAFKPLRRFVSHQQETKGDLQLRGQMWAINKVLICGERETDNFRQKHHYKYVHATIVSDLPLRKDYSCIRTKFKYFGLGLSSNGWKIDN